MHNQGYNHGNKWSERTENDLHNKKSFKFDSYQMMAAKNHIISVVSHKVILKRT